MLWYILHKQFYFDHLTKNRESQPVIANFEPIIIAWMDLCEFLPKENHERSILLFQTSWIPSGPCSLLIEWHSRLKVHLVLFYRCSFYLIPKASWAIAYFWLQLTYTCTYSYNRCFVCTMQISRAHRFFQVCKLASFSACPPWSRTCVFFCRKKNSHIQK